MLEQQGDLFKDYDIEPPAERYPAAFLSRPDRPPHLKGIKIEGLKCINDIEVDLQPPLTVFTGPNNSGKSTILQAILLGFDLFRRCIDTDAWTIRDAGRSVTELDYLRVNQLKDLWFKQLWKPSKTKERYIRVGLTFDNGFKFVSRVRYLYGALNIGIESFKPTPDIELVKAISSSAPIIISASPGPQAHEPAVSLAQLHYTLGAGDSARVLHNILLQLEHQSDKEPWEFVKGIVKRHFAVELDKIDFDDTRDLEIRSPYSEAGYSLDIVSGGSGLNQVLQLGAIIAWRKPGIVLLDEPDAHLHTTLQARLLDLLYELADRYGMQVIISTHSRDIISQAPLETIIPIDLSRSHIKPMASLEHLLLEFERQGIVSNVDLALLYQTKKCLFVEGPSDSRLLPKIAEQTGVEMFKGRNQIVMFEFRGVDNLKLIPQVVSLFQRMIGAQLSWAVLRDRDANLPGVLDEYKSQAKDSGIQNLFIWETYSLENLLLDVDLLKMALNKKYTDKPISNEQIRELLHKAAEIVGSDVDATYITNAQNAYRSLGMENAGDKGAADALKFIRSLDTLEKKLKYYPGKKVFGQFVQLLQSEHDLTLRLDEVVQSLNLNNIPNDIKELNKMLSGL
jgi:predicted ATPase